MVSRKCLVLRYAGKITTEIGKHAILIDSSGVCLMSE